MAKLRGAVSIGGTSIGEGEVKYTIASDLAFLNSAVVAMAEFNNTLKQLEVTIRLGEEAWKDFDWWLNWYKDPGSAWWEQ